MIDWTWLPAAAYDQQVGNLGKRPLRSGMSANPRHRGATKAERRLLRRIEAWQEHNSAGATHKPGSLKK